MNLLAMKRSMEQIDSPLITVVTVVFNDVQHIEETILSVVNQTYPNIEYIIIDGGSTDGTVDIIKKYEERIAYWVSEPDKGIYDAMNKGIQKAMGEWINFMNAGDVYAANDVLVQLMQCEHSEARILRGNIIRVYPHMKVKSVGVTTNTPNMMDMFNNTFHHQACLIQKSLFEEVGFYSLQYRLCSDWKFFFDCVVLHHIKSRYMDVTVALFRMDGNSTNHSVLYLKEQEEYLETLYGQELFELLRELSVYRKSGLIRMYYKIRKSAVERLSQKNFNRLLTLKRIIRACLGLNVN